MGRLAKFTHEQILDAAAQLIAADGPAQVSVAAIAAELGAPSGSIYHRFASRDLLLAHLWLRTVRRAQEGFIAALAEPDLARAAEAAALHLPRWSRDHLPEARLLLLYRREDLAERWPQELGEDAERLNDGLQEAMAAFTRRRYGSATPTQMETVRFALIDVPYAAARRYLLAGRPPPPTVDRLVRRACTCFLQEMPGV